MWQNEPRGKTSAAGKVYLCLENRWQTMERQDVFDCSGVLIASYFTDDRGCVHENREHTLIYICSGRLEIDDKGERTVLDEGCCAFMRRDNRMWLHKYVSEGRPYRSVVLKFSRPFLRDFYRRLDPSQIPLKARRAKSSLCLLPYDRPDVRSLFESVLPYFDSGVRPTEEVLRLKMTEGLYVLLNTDKDLFASLFDFVEPWKIDILDFLNDNYMYDLSMDEIARYTGRSLATFKRDFAKVSDLSPRRWLIRRRLEAARDPIRSGKRGVSEVCFEVGFKNLSHFSRAFKEMYGCSPANVAD